MGRTHRRVHIQTFRQMHIDKSREIRQHISRPFQAFDKLTALPYGGAFYFPLALCHFAQRCLCAVAIRFLAALDM